MRELVITLPLRASHRDADLATHSAFQRALRKHFGGFTRHYADGSWLDDAGVVHDDSSNVYTVAARWTREERDVIDGLIWGTGHVRLGQQAVYVRRPDGVVRIVEKDESIWPWWKRIAL